MPAPARRPGLWLLALALTACSAGPGPDAPAPSVAPVAAETCAPGRVGAGCKDSPPPGAFAADSICSNGSPGPRCDGLLGAEELKLIGPEIEAARKAMLDSKYTNVKAMVHLACLQLRRDEDSADPDGRSDAERGKYNAMRAAAVDESSPEARLALALSVARSVQGAAVPATSRGFGLLLVDVALAGIPPTDGPAGAATKVLEGFVALERGDKEKARSAFTRAVQMDARFGTAWVGLGDTARAEGGFDEAVSAYEKAAALLPADSGVVRSLHAARRKEALALPTAPLPLKLALSTGPIAPAPAPLVPCTAELAAMTPELCKSLARLTSSKAKSDLDAAARAVMDDWPNNMSRCEGQDPSCGPQVAAAYTAAARGFRAAGYVGKAINAAKIVIVSNGLPAAQALRSELLMEVGDMYFGIGIFDQAADYYARYLKTSGAPSEAAAERALLIGIGMSQIDTAKKLADELSRDTRYPAERRADWLLATASLIRAVEGPAAAADWLDRRRASLGTADPAEVGQIGRPLRSGDAATCASPLACGVRRIAGEAW